MAKMRSFMDAKTATRVFTEAITVLQMKNTEPLQFGWWNDEENRF